MSVTVLTAPDARTERAADSAEAVVTITVQITLAGDELPIAASRLLSDLEALVGRETKLEPATGKPRQLRLVDSSAARPAPAHSPSVEVNGDLDDKPQVRRIGSVDNDGPSLFLHTGSRMLIRDGVPVELTRREYDLFQFFCENPRRVFTRSQLLRQVWGYDMVGTERTVDVHVRRLRVKLGECASIITTVRGVGYRLDDDAPVDIVVQED
jgi:two-component system, OmpR family, response regulator